jgi:hypothetical protein
MFERGTLYLREREKEIKKERKKEKEILMERK